MSMYKDVPEALAIHAAADPARIYHYRDDITGVEFRGKCDDVKREILKHDDAHNLETSVGPVDVHDVEAWALLEAIYN